MPGACGTQIKERIIGGELTSIVDYPWSVILLTFLDPLKLNDDFLITGLL